MGASSSIVRNARVINTGGLRDVLGELRDDFMVLKVKSMDDTRQHDDLPELTASNTGICRIILIS